MISLSKNGRARLADTVSRTGSVGTQRQDSQSTRHRLVVELVGPAGAGKTTLARALCQRDVNVSVAADISLRKAKHFSVFMANVPSLLPYLRRFQDRYLSWDEVKAMIYLNGWPSLLRHQAQQPGMAILLDHGPIFKLATLRAFGPRRLQEERFQKWWQDRFRQWAATLDMVIWLDAPDKDLVKRINHRGQKHTVKGRTDVEAIRFLARYRRAYDVILTDVAGATGPAALRFDTSRVGIDQIVDQVQRALQNGLPGPRQWESSSK